MNLREIILNFHQYADTDELMHVVFAKKTKDKFEPLGEAKVLKLTLEDMEMSLTDIQNSKCPGYDYFLEMNIIQDFFEEVNNSKEFKSDDEKVNRIIYYAEFDA